MKKKNTKYVQYVVIEWHNAGVSVYKFVSHHPITLEEIAGHFEREDDFNVSCDSLWVIDEAPIRKELK